MLQLFPATTKSLAQTNTMLSDLHSPSKNKHNATLKSLHHKNQLNSATPLNCKNQTHLTCKQTKNTQIQKQQ
jgi:hypothetical protein